jgi:hypothetical protein
MLVQGTRTHAFHDAWFANAGVHLYLVLLHSEFDRLNP